MSDCKGQPSCAFVRTASAFSLRSYELSRLNHTANLLKEISSLLDQWLKEKAHALLARWLVEEDEHRAEAFETFERVRSRRASFGEAALFSSLVQER
jgi:hypothetical protein